VRAELLLLSRVVFARVLLLMLSHLDAHSNCTQGHAVGTWTQSSAV
jgi:hypothetical protein